MLNVRDFGAVGDGIALDTAALQKAFEQGSSTGETVFFPAGIYRAGTLHLSSHLHIKLGNGAVLKVSEDIADFSEDTRQLPGALRFYFLWGADAEDIRISGSGTIDGSGFAFWENHYFNGQPLDGPIADDPLSYQVLVPKAQRPCPIYCENCRNLLFRDFTMIDSACYTLWCLGCTDGLIENLKVRNPRNGPNSDVLDLDCCTHFTVRNCDLYAGDDCVALKSDGARLGRMQPCERITVEDCRLVSATCAIRLGYEGDAPIRDCTFRNIEITDTRHGIDIQSVAPGSECKSSVIITGTPISDIRFENIVMRNTARAFFFWAGNIAEARTYAAEISNLTFRNIDAEVLDGSFIGSVDGIAIHDLTFEKVKLAQTRELPPAEADFLPSHWGERGFGAALVLRRVENVLWKEDCILSSTGKTPRMIQFESKRISGLDN